MTTHWAETYLGIPWSATGEGPARGGDGGTQDRETWSFHCWAFVRHIQERRFGRELPAIPNPTDVLAIARGFRDHPERKRWVKVCEAKEGDCVLMRQARYPIHVGVWISVDGGGVLHCAEEAGVAFQSLSSLALNGWQVEGFYRFIG
ncbi:MAG: NlpC/P60 family protein [Gammaproteobacteria bacterium]